MRNRKWYEWLLTVVYIAMVLACVYLNLYSRQPEGKENIIVNVIMFVLVGLVFLNAERNSFFPMNDIIADLRKATERIRKDAMDSHAFLWEQYQKDQVQLFSVKRLQELYEDYLYEIKRIAKLGSAEKTYYKCDLEDYLNYELVDTVMHRNLLNQVAGAMTGLGILGTFVGLSLGLQSFSTGTTAEITNSIAPLMDGIKVAFHTSIYGMIFSLSFNYAYKRKLDEGENAVRGFLNAYKKYVLPDRSADGINRLIELQQNQLESLMQQERRLPEHLRTVLDAPFKELNKTIQDFANLATKNQMDALEEVVLAFVRELNKSMGNAFTQLSDTVNREYQSQQQNARLMQDLLTETGAGQENVEEINKQVVAILDALDGFTESVRAANAGIGRTVSGLQSQSEASQELIRQEQKYLTDLAAYRHSLDQFAETFNASLQTQERLLEDIRGTVQKLPRDLGNTLKLLDDSLEDVEIRMQRLNDAVRKIPEGTEERYTKRLGRETR